MRFWATLFAVTFLASNAWAGAGTVTGKDASGATVTFATTTDGSSNNLAHTVICDATAGANCAAVQSASADGVSNSTAALAVYNFPLLWNGTTWDRWKGDATNGAFVNIKNSSIAVTGTFWQATQPVSNAGTFAVQASPGTIATWGLMSGTTPGTAPTNTQVIGGIYNSSAPSPTTGQTLPLQQDSSGNLNVNVKSATGVGIGSATSGQTLSLIGCASTTAIPTATTAETWPVSCDPGNSIRVVNGASTYNTVAASQTAQALTGGSGGATGDYLSHCTIIPTSTSPGVVTILDNSTTIYSFPGGASSLSNLVPFTIPIGAQSTTGAWKVTTGVSLSVVCVGRFH